MIVSWQASKREPTWTLTRDRAVRIILSTAVFGVGLLHAALFDPARAADNSRAPIIQIAEFCRPFLSSDELKSDAILQTALALPRQNGLAATSIMRIDESRSEHGVENLPESLSFYFVAMRDRILVTCSSMHVNIQSGTIDPNILISGGSEEEGDQQAFQFRVWTNCGTGCAYDSDYIVVKSQSGVSEFYVAQTGNDSDLALRVCPLTYEFRVVGVDLDKSKVRGLMSATIECGEENVDCSFSLPERELELSLGEGVPFFRQSDVKQFSPLDDPYFMEFVDTHERQLAYPHDAATDPCR